jgi:hypothetical protein
VAFGDIQVGDFINMLLTEEVPGVAQDKWLRDYEVISMPTASADNLDSYWVLRPPWSGGDDVVMVQSFIYLELKSRGATEVSAR